MSDNWKVGKKRNQGLESVELEKAVLVGLSYGEQTQEDVRIYLDELAFLAKTAGAEVIKVFEQKLPQPDSKYFIGKGKLQEIIQYKEIQEYDMVIFDDDLTGKQTNLLEKELGVKIIDRSSLILDIFAKRAQTAQAKTQVELAQLQYLLPRLRGLWSHLERQRGGIGMRGPGEQEIETDRRIVRDKIALLKQKLVKIETQNTTQRKQRGELVRVSLVGYTNVGKSTLMNLLTKSEVFAEDKLFATLDTTVRKMVIGTMPFLLSDTVGFIRKLPHHLIESFKSTLDEVRESDILLHVIDISHPQFEDQIKTVLNTLKELKVEDKSLLFIYNKVDLYRDVNFDDLLDNRTRKEILDQMKISLDSTYDNQSVFISAKEKENIDLLRNRIKEMVEYTYEVRYPYMVKTW
ncbi:MAG TPA: GTPase HflX [Saprospirales bacterium]|nr:GTPase HflX [Saprospirales bacterium]HAY70406.1 GTPase HflX [Saprospirales bacterium]HRQ30106.1 GTPase HflX [Saprospiraceae bacterium]